MVVWALGRVPEGEFAGELFLFLGREAGSLAGVGVDEAFDAEVVRVVWAVLLLRGEERLRVLREGGFRGWGVRELREGGEGGFVLGGFLDLHGWGGDLVRDGVDCWIEEGHVRHASAAVFATRVVAAVSSAVDVLWGGEVGFGSAHFGGKVDSVSASAELGADFFAISLEEQAKELLPLHLVFW